MSHQPTLISCPQCSRLRKPSSPCPYCRSAQQRRLTIAMIGVVIAVAVLSVLLAALILSTLLAL